MKQPSHAGRAVNADLTLGYIERLTGCRLGTFDIACPTCGPGRRTLQNRTRKVLRVWRKEPGFASFKCVRCGVEGGVGEKHRTIRTRFARRVVEVDDHRERQAEKANALWRRRLPTVGSPVEAYLREARHYAGPIPATIGFLLPFRPGQNPAMIAAFGLAVEPEPGEIAIGEVVAGIHLTLLRADGRGKAGTDRDKLMVGPSNGWPIVLAPPNDILGLVVCEGIETGLSLCEATGCGVWAAGAAGRMPALADKVPHYLNAITIAAEADTAGQTGARELAARLRGRGLHTEIKVLDTDVPAEAA